MGNMAMAPVPIQLGDQEYLLSPLTDRDWGEIDFWIRSEFLRTAKSAAGVPGSEEYDTIMRIALLEAPTLVHNRWPGSKMLATAGGVARIAQQSLKKKHPQLTLDEVFALLRTSEAKQELREKFELANDSNAKKAEAVPSSDARPTPSRSSTPSSSNDAESIPEVSRT